LLVAPASDETFPETTVENHYYHHYHYYDYCYSGKLNSGKLNSGKLQGCAVSRSEPEPG
jgi:hypothetical protein